MTISAARAHLIALLCLSSVVGCSNTTRPQLTTDLTAGLQVASALEAAYAASPHADPKVLAQLTRLLASAQAAMTAFDGSTSATDQAVASAAIAALVEYEASAHVAL